MGSGSSSRELNKGHQPGGGGSGLQTLENAAQEKTFRRKFDNELDFKSICIPEIL